MHVWLLAGSELFTLDYLLSCRECCQNAALVNAKCHGNLHRPTAIARASSRVRAQVDMKVFKIFIFYYHKVQITMINIDIMEIQSSIIWSQVSPKCVLEFSRRNKSQIVFPVMSESRYKGPVSRMTCCK